MAIVPSSTISSILQLKQTIEKSLDDCLKKLDKLPIEGEHLLETLMGTTVIRLCGYDGRTGAMATALMNKWNDIITMTTFETENCEDPLLLEAMHEKYSEQL